MPYDRDLAERIRGVLAGEPDLEEKTAFGGLAAATATPAPGRQGRPRSRPLRGRGSDAAGKPPSAG